MNSVGAIKPMDQDEQQLQTVISDILTAALRDTIYPVDFSIYSTCPRAEVEPLDLPVIYPVHYDSLAVSVWTNESVCQLLWLCSCLYLCLYLCVPVRVCVCVLSIVFSSFSTHTYTNLHCWPCSLSVFLFLFLSLDTQTTNTAHCSNATPNNHIYNVYISSISLYVYCISSRAAKLSAVLSFS